jgi:predicted DNA-binding transcriptional regulator AlpA
MDEANFVQKLPEPPVERLLVSVNYAAAMLGLGRSSTYELINSGRLESVAVLKRRLVKVASVRRVADEGSAS